MLYIYIFSIFNLFQSMVYLIHFSKSFREEQTDQTIMHKIGVREGRKGEIKSRKNSLSVSCLSRSFSHSRFSFTCNFPSSLIVGIVWFISSDTDAASSHVVEALFQIFIHKPEVCFGTVGRSLEFARPGASELQSCRCQEAPGLPWPPGGWHLASLHVPTAWPPPAASAAARSASVLEDSPAGSPWSNTWSGKVHVSDSSFVFGMSKKWELEIFLKMSALIRA